MSNAEVTAPEHRKVIGRPFQSGQSGNPAGRPKGARSKFSEAFIADLHAVWEERGIGALEKCAAEDPGTFIRVCASLMPKDVNLNVGIGVTDFVGKFRDAVALLGNDPASLPPRPLRAISGR